jgi:hypothetical protein
VNADEHLTPEDRRWLRAHGWTPPPPRPVWDDEAEEMVVKCPDCGERLVVEHEDAIVFHRAGPLRIVGEVGPVLKAHARKCGSS